MNKLNDEQLQLKNDAEKLMSEFYKSYCGDNKNFKLYSIEHFGKRIFIKLSSFRKTDKFIETGSIYKNVTGGANYDKWQKYRCRKQR